MVYEVVPPQVQDPALALVERHQVPLCPAFQPIQVTLNGSTAFWCIYHTSQFGVISSDAKYLTVLICAAGGLELPPVSP